MYEVIFLMCMKLKTISQKMSLFICYFHMTGCIMEMRVTSHNSFSRPVDVQNTQRMFVGIICS